MRLVIRLCLRVLIESKSSLESNAAGSIRRSKGLPQSVRVNPVAA